MTDKRNIGLDSFEKRAIGRLLGTVHLIDCRNLDFSERARRVRSTCSVCSGDQRTMLVSQCHEQIGNPTLADDVLDRLLGTHPVERAANQGAAEATKTAANGANGLL